MSAIGDYVHLTYTGYVKGPELGSGKPPFFDSYKSILTNRENHFNQWVQNQENKVIKELEKKTQESLNLLKSFKENKGNISQVEGNELAMALLDDLWNELGEKYLKVDKIAAAASGLIDIGSFQSGVNVGKNTFRQQMTTGNINMQINNFLNNTLNSINDTVSKILIDKNLNTDKISKAVTKTQNNINKFFMNLQNQCKVINLQNQKRTSEQINKIFKNLKNAIQETEALNGVIDIEGLLNNLAFGLSAGITSNQYKGDISEALIAVIAQRMAGVVLKEADSTIRSAVVSGQERSSRGIDTKVYFSSDIDWNQALAGKKFVQPYGDFIVSADAVQDKVDIKIELDDGGHAYISAKNYNIKSLEKGVTNTSASFLTLIQNENNGNLINHYLNLNAVNGKGRQSLRTSMEEVNNFIRKLTIAKLITGYNTITGAGGNKMAEANVFAVFNSNDYTVKFYNMKEVLEGIFNGNKYQKMYIPSYFYKSNIKTSDYRTRISNIIKQLNVAVSYTLKEEEYNK